MFDKAHFSNHKKNNYISKVQRVSSLTGVFKNTFTQRFNSFIKIDRSALSKNK